MKNEHFGPSAVPFYLLGSVREVNIDHKAGTMDLSRYLLGEEAIPRAVQSSAVS